MKNQLKLTLFIFLSILTGIIFFSCKEKTAEPDSYYVAAVTGGIIGRSDPVIVEFVFSQDTSKIPEDKVFSFSPSAKGTVSWQDEFTLVFTPSEPYRPGQLYRVRVNPDGVPAFNFEFTAAFPVFSVQLEPVEISANNEVFVSGTVTADDDADWDKIEQTISSNELGRPSWRHNDGLHNFYFDSVVREETSRTAEVTWDGRPIGSTERGSASVIIPGLDVFQMIGLRMNNGVIEVSFSSPLRPNQDMRGFVSLSGNTNVRYSVESNMIKIFGDNSGGIPAGAQLVIQDLEDIHGNHLNAPIQYTVPDGWELPEIRFAGAGVILPTSQGAQLVVETRNVSGILIEAFQIHGDNMIQFLQVNSLTGSSELNRVGEPVWKRDFNFSWDSRDQNRWIRRGLDMSELSRRFPGGMFHIRISFRPRHVQYVCSEDHADFSGMEFPDDNFPSYSTDEPSFWNSYYYSPTYNWSEWYKHREDPCHPAFYISMSGHNITKSRNVYVSDLGLMAKRAIDGSWLIAATNLLTARPSPDTEIRVHNFQGRLVYQGRTGADGTVLISAERATEMGSGSRLVLYAQNNLGRAYLRINDSISMAVSHFDIAGGSPSTGLRGLIYGERDVWRPGDEVFLTFLLADPMNTLPADHPVSFELEDPRGRPVLTRTYTTSVDGFYPISFSTASSAPTGDWTARVRVGGSTFSRNVKIETIMPNRLKMDLDFADREIITSGTHRVALESQWLYGAPASGLKSDISVSFSDKETTFPAYADFSFRDPSRTVSSQRQDIWEGTLNRDGKASFEMALNPGNSVPGKVTARFMTRVFEPSGVFSSEQISMEYSPYSRYVGVKTPRGDAARNMLLTDTNHQAEIVLLDENGNPVQGNVQLNCAIYKLSWRWWWEQGGDEAAEFASTLSRNPISRGSVTAVNGRASWNFRVNYPDWGRYLIIVNDSSGGHAAAQIVFIDWPGWAGRPQTEGQDSSSMLVLTPSKPSYNAGERVQISFPSNGQSSAHVVLEKGGRVIRSEWIRCENETTRFEFTADASMLPNLYAHVTLLQPHLQTVNDLPIRLYGIVPVMVDDPNIVLRPQITANANWEAESQVSFTVSEASGRPMAYTVAVVDEGLLGLTRFRLPNPRNTFYAKEASFLKSWDLFQEVIGAYSGRLETLLAIGGGDDIDPDTSKETQRFKPVVRFFGPFEIGRGARKTETFDLPPYIGALRIMVLAASSTSDNQTRSQRAYGTAETSVTVTSDLMVFATLPRTLSPGDEVEVPVYVNSFTPGRRNVRVNLSVPGAEIVGQASQDVSFERSEEKLVRFKVKAPANPRALQFTVRAESQGLKTAQHVVDLEVRSTAIPVAVSTYNLVQPGDTWRGNLAYPGRDGTNTLAAAFSRLPPLNLDARLEWLIAYPHGCIEQTTSGAFPQLYLDKIINMSESRRAVLRTNVNAGITRVLGMQLMSGGFSYWPGDSGAHDWASSYVGHFLLEARKAGYSVPSNAMRSWVNYQKNIAANWQAGSGKFTEQAYRLYTLALAGEADIGSMNRLRSQQNMPVQATWRLAAAYWIAGQRDTARNMINGLSMPQGDYRELSGTFGSALRDKAMILETLVLMNAEHDRIFPLFEEMSKTLSSDVWLSTQETAYALIAMTPYIQNNTAASNLQLSYTAAGRSGNISFSTPSAEENFGTVTGTESQFTVTNRSSIPVYVVFTARGLPAEGSEPALSQGITLFAEYRNSDGRVINPANLKVGEDMEVVVRVRNSFTGVIEEAAVIIPVPASWEIVNTRVGGAASSSAFRYQDIRDDRVMTYFNLNRGEERTIRFTVNKAYEGSFYRPAIHAYAMYDESIRALIPGVK